MPAPSASSSPTSSPGLLAAMGDDDLITATITTPVTMFTQADGAAIKAQLPAPGVNATLRITTDVDRDGTLDNTIVAHEWGHYISNRLIADSSGLTSNQSSGLGEGWADFHALLLLVKGGDASLPNNANFSGTYAIGAYALGTLVDPDDKSYYYGFRRYPYSRDMTKNPLTFRHIASGVALPAFARAGVRRQRIEQCRSPQHRRGVGDDAVGVLRQPAQRYRAAHVR
jgi:hypothetical protein